MTDADGLAARLAAMRERQARAAGDRYFEAVACSIPLLRALEGAGEPYESGGYDRLVGAANQWAHDPNGSAFAVGTAQPMTRAYRYERVNDALNRFLTTSEKLTVILRAEAIVVAVGAEQVVRYLAEILASGDGAEIGFLREDGGFLEVRRKLISEGALGDA